MKSRAKVVGDSPDRHEENPGCQNEKRKVPYKRNVLRRVELDNRTQSQRVELLDGEKERKGVGRRLDPPVK